MAEPKLVMPETDCPTEAALELIGGKWKGLILFYLSGETRRFNELMRLVPGVSQRMLTKQLRELEAGGVIHREVYPVVPPKVEYSLTELGQALSPVIKGLEQWGKLYMAQQERSEDES